MAGLKTLLGLYPKTAEYESKRKQLSDEFNALLEFETSNELARYKELEHYLQSTGFASLRQELLSLRYSDSEEYRKEKDFGQLKSERDIKQYLKTEQSSILKLYLQIDNSEKLERFNELDKYVKSAEFTKIKDYYSQSGKKRFEQSDLGKKFADFIAKSKSDKIKGYQKFVNSSLFKDYQAIKDSDKLSRYEELKKAINSSAFFTQKASMKKADFMASESGAQLREFQMLAKSGDIKNYLKHSASPFLSTFNSMTDSGEYESFLELKNEVNSPEFIQQRSAIEKSTFKTTEEFQLETEYKKLASDSDLKKYFAFIKSSEFANYKTIKDSSKLEKYIGLKEYIASEAFNEKKKYLTLSPKTRWKQSEPFAKQQEFENLKNSESIRWYFKNINHQKFDWFRTWQSTFDEDFETGKLDKNRWLTRYYWGEEMMKESYSLFNEKHYITDGKNLEFNGSTMRIVTRKETAEGKIWDPEFGFIPREFNYSSGLINTGKSFRQLHGLFEAKIKINNNPQVLNAFWMVGEKMLPHIDIVNAQKKCGIGVISENGVFKKTLGRNKFASDYYIYSLEWTTDKIVWKINGLEVAIAKNNIPQEEMYLNLNAGLYSDIESGLPAAMEIDWVRCYKVKN